MVPIRRRDPPRHAPAPGGVVELDQNLKKLMRELGATIQDALSGSEEIGAAIQNVKDAGYDVLLVLEATIGLNRRGPAAESADAEDAPRDEGSEVQLKVNAQDMKFLKSLKIRIDDPNA